MRRTGHQPGVPCRKTAIDVGDVGLESVRNAVQLGHRFCYLQFKDVRDQLIRPCHIAHLMLVHIGARRIAQEFIGQRAHIEGSIIDDHVLEFHAAAFKQGIARHLTHASSSLRCRKASIRRTNTCITVS